VLGRDEDEAVSASDAVERGALDDMGGILAWPLASVKALAAAWPTSATTTAAPGAAGPRPFRAATGHLVVPFHDAGPLGASFATGKARAGGATLGVPLRRCAFVLGGDPRFSWDADLAAVGRVARRAEALVASLRQDADDAIAAAAAAAAAVDSKDGDESNDTEDEGDD